MASSHRGHTLEGRTEKERRLTVSFVHHGLDDHWKHPPVQVKVQLRKGGKNSQTELEGEGGVGVLGLRQSSRGQTKRTGGQRPGCTFVFLW